MRKEKKYNYVNLIEGITRFFGSVEQLAGLLNTSRENIYQLTRRQTPKYLGRLEKLGMDLDNIPLQNINLYANNFGNQTTSGNNSHAIGTADKVKITNIEGGNNEDLEIAKIALKSVMRELDECKSKRQEVERQLIKANTEIAKLREKLNNDVSPNSKGEPIKNRSKEK